MWGVSVFVSDTPSGSDTGLSQPFQGHQESRSGSVVPIDVATLHRLIKMDPNLLLVDVRNLNELRGPTGRIKSAFNLPLKKIQQIFNMQPRQKTLVFICETGPRSVKAAKILAQKGYTAYYVKGGMQAWKKFGNQKSDTTETGNDFEETTPSETVEDFGC